MNGDISLGREQLSGTLSQVSNLSGTLSRAVGLSGALALGVNPGKYYTKEEIDEMLQSVSGKIVSATTYLEFPVVGSTDTIYIDSTHNRVYRWDDDSLKYFCVGSDYNEIDIIDGGWNE